MDACPEADRRLLRKRTEMGNCKTCLGCAKRQVGCHAVCEEYLTYKTENEQRNKAIREYKNNYYQANAFTYATHAKYVRKHGLTKRK